MSACEECGNDDPCEGYRLCTDCLEECERFDWDSWSDAPIREQGCVRCGRRQRDHKESAA